MADTSSAARSWVGAYGAALVTFVIVDALWLTTIGGALFARHLGDWLSPQPHLGAAAAFYLIYALGLTVLAVRPHEPPRSVKRAAVDGACFGLAAYATFDLTCLAILERYTLTLALADMTWGTAVSAGAAAAGAAAARWRERAAAP